MNGGSSASVEEIDDSSMVVDLERLLARATSRADIWEAVIGQSIEHVSLGVGRIVHVDRTRKGSVYLKIRFESVNKVSEFNAGTLAKFFQPRLVIDASRHSQALPRELLMTPAEHRRVLEARTAAREREANERKLRAVEEQETRRELEGLKSRFLAKGASALAPTSRLAEILRALNQHNLPSDEDLEFLEQAQEWGPLAFYHQLVFERTGDPRFGVKACSFWRAAKQPKRTIVLAKHLIGLGYEPPMSYRSVAAAYTSLGAAYTDLGNTEEGRRCAGRALKIQPSYHQHNLLGRICFMEGEAAQGLYHFEKAKKLGSRDVWFHMRRALSATRIEHRSKIASFLLRSNPQLYQWAADFT